MMTSLSPIPAQIHHCCAHSVLAVIVSVSIVGVDVVSVVSVNVSQDMEKNPSEKLVLTSQRASDGQISQGEERIQVSMDTYILESADRAQTQMDNLGLGKNLSEGTHKVSTKNASQQIEGDSPWRAQRDGQVGI